MVWDKMYSDEDNGRLDANYHQINLFIVMLNIYI